jgi:hypothetical protein
MAGTSLRYHRSAVPAPKVLVARRGAVTLLTLNRPEVHNCVDGETAGLITADIESFAADTEARVLVVTGAGHRAFCAGADLKAIDELMRRPETTRTGPLGLFRSAAGPLSGARLAGGRHGLKHLLHALCWIAAVAARGQDARQLARLGPGQDRAGAHLEPPRHLRGTEQDLQVAGRRLLLASLTELVIGRPGRLPVS